MALYDFEQYLFRLKNDPKMQQELASDPRAHLAEHGVETEAVEAILRKDVAALWRMGVHPLLLVPLSRFLGMPPQEYRARLRPLVGERTFSSRVDNA